MPRVVYQLSDEDFRKMYRRVGNVVIGALFVGFAVGVLFVWCFWEVRWPR